VDIELGQIRALTPVMSVSMYQHYRAHTVAIIASRHNQRATCRHPRSSTKVSTPDDPGFQTITSVYEHGTRHQHNLIWMHFDILLEQSGPENSKHV
jgi:hypothetical protein